MEPSWNYPSLSQDFDSTNSLGVNSLQTSTDGTIPINQCATLDQLAGSLADDLTLQNEFLQGWALSTENLTFTSFQTYEQFVGLPTEHTLALLKYYRLDPIVTVQNQAPPPPYQATQSFTINALSMVQTYAQQPQNQCLMQSQPQCIAEVHSNSIYYL